VESQRLPAPIFAPTTKNGERNENIHYQALQNLLGESVAEQLRETSLRLYFNAWKSAREQGVLIADTKFEFGLHDGKLMLIDECLTPETSRFWEMSRYRSGGPMPSMDKQILVDFLDSLGTPEMIPLPDEMLARLGEKYHEAYKLITGKKSYSKKESLENYSEAAS
jgi:phosphoribosylaminoimidazole-succinocarboxamide synthase